MIENITLDTNNLRLVMFTIIITIQGLDVYVLKTLKCAFMHQKCLNMLVKNLMYFVVFQKNCFYKYCFINNYR